MNREQYIKNRFQKILTENLNDKANEILERLHMNYDKEVPFNKTGESFDYVEEELDEMFDSDDIKFERRGKGYKDREFRPIPKFGIDRLDIDFDSITPKKERELRKNKIRNDEFDEFDEFDEIMEGETCEQCGSNMDEINNMDELTEEGETCEQCGSKIKTETMETKKPTKKQIEDLLDENLYEIEFEGEVGEGNLFTGALAKAKEEGKKTFEVDGKKYSVKENYERLMRKKTKRLVFTEEQLIDFIENMINEEKNSFKMSEPKGYGEYAKVHRQDKKENDENLKRVAKKMSEYVKKSSDDVSKFEMKETKKFPTQNGGVKKGIRKKYTPSEAVDEYEDAFSYPGMTNLVFDEIKPNEEKIKKYLKGDKTTGNAQVDEDGNALGNVVPSEVGEKFHKNYKENLYGQEQMNASYKRQPQPVDQAGEKTERGTLKSKRGKKTSQEVLNNLDENKVNKESKRLNEEFEKIQKLMNYNKKTQ
jgi:DNA-directed RNA polymerase subunit RPC12/RpoP